MTVKKVCLNCGKEVHPYKYFCNIHCESEHTAQLNTSNN